MMMKPAPVLFRSLEIENRHRAEVLPDGSWRGHPAFIVGGGPSVRAHDLAKLRGHRSISVNIAFFWFSPTIIFSMDTRCLNWIIKGQYEALYPGLRDRFARTVSYKIWLLTYKATLPEGIFIDLVAKNYENGLTAFTFGRNEGLGHGNNSGYAALNLAVRLGADPIYLLGFDCKQAEGGRSHFHNGHPIPQNPTHLEKFIGRFEAAAPKIKAHGTRVVNLSPASAIRCFEFGNYEEALNA